MRDVSLVAELLGITTADVRRLSYATNYDILMVETWNRRRLFISGLDMARGMIDPTSAAFSARLTARVVTGRMDGQVVRHVFVHVDEDWSGWTRPLGSRGEWMSRAARSATGWVHGLASLNTALLGGLRTTSARVWHALKARGRRLVSGSGSNGARRTHRKRNKD